LFREQLCQSPQIIACAGIWFVHENDGGIRAACFRLPHFTGQSDFTILETNVLGFVAAPKKKPEPEP
jgi:hypothetical protein